MSMDEYQARQQANEARNQRSQGSSKNALVQRRVQEIRAHLEKALALLDEETNSEVSAELRSAAEKLATIR